MKFNYIPQTKDTAFISGLHEDNLDVKKIIIPDEIDGYIISGIYCEAFRNNDAITEVVIPNTVVHIGSSAFDGCKSLMQVNIPDITYKVYPYAFANCPKLETVVLGRKAQINWFATNIFSGTDNINTIKIGVRNE